MKSYIIGIAGKAGTGKDTVASMVNYIFNVGITKANYVEYVMTKKSVEYTHADRIIHFADALKDILSRLFGINRKYFDDREYKDYYWYCFNTGKFVDPTAIEKNRHGYHLICHNELIGFDLSYILNHIEEDFSVIKLRTLMQYFGTDICRRYLSDDVWIKATIRDAIDIANARRLCIIPDVRFSNECDAIDFDTESLYGRTILVKRDVEQQNHASEFIECNPDYVIDNNGTLTSLFYKVLEVIQEMMKN